MIVQSLPTMGTSVFPLSETGVLRDFWGCIMGAKYRFPLQDGTWDFPGDAVAGKGLILLMPLTVGRL